MAGEGSNVILNVCYEKENVDAILMCGGVEPLVRFLGERKDPDLQANAAGAIQSICFQDKGRVSVRDLDGVPAMLRLLVGGFLSCRVVSCRPTRSLVLYSLDSRLIQRGDVTEVHASTVQHTWLSVVHTHVVECGTHTRG